MIEGNALHKKKKQGQSTLKRGYETAPAMSKANIIYIAIIIITAMTVNVCKTQKEIYYGVTSILVFSIQWF